MFFLEYFIFRSSIPSPSRIFLFQKKHTDLHVRQDVLGKHLYITNICIEQISVQSQYLYRENIFIKPASVQSQCLYRANICIEPTSVQSKHLYRTNNKQTFFTIQSIFVPTVASVKFHSPFPSMFLIFFHKQMLLQKHSFHLNVNKKQFILKPNLSDYGPQTQL